MKRSIGIILILSIIIPYSLCRQMCGGEPCCRCGKTYGACTLGDETMLNGLERGGCKDGISCSVDCPGDYPWKKLYNESLKKEKELIHKCQGDPTKHWEKAELPGNDDRYAIGFAGALRNFVATFHSWEVNVIEASNSSKIDLYFHVWDSESQPNGTFIREAKKIVLNYPNTKGLIIESMKNYLTYLNQDQPSVGLDSPYLKSNSKKSFKENSWIGDIDEELSDNDIPPFRIGAGYSQWRKVYLCLEMIKKSKIKYHLIFRARPDHTVLEPFDLRQLHRDYSQYHSVKKAKGHFIALGERSKQVITDHWAIGTPQAMYEYAAQALPFTISCCEGYVWTNLAHRCFARNADVLQDEFSDVDAVRKEVEKVDHLPEWYEVPRWGRGFSEYAPLMLTFGSLNSVGLSVCKVKDRNTNQISSSCIPILRTRFSYVFKIETSPWFSNGALCIRYTNEGDLTAKFLMKIGIAKSLPLIGVEEKFSTSYCLRVPTLKKAFIRARKYFDSLDFKSQSELINRDKAMEMQENEDDAMFQWSAERRRKRK